MKKIKVRVIAPISGGKDSEAAAIWAKEKYGKDKVTTVFCDVKWEADETYEHIDYLVEKLDVEHIVLTSKKYDGMVGICRVYRWLRRPPRHNVGDEIH